MEVTQPTEHQAQKGASCDSAVQRVRTASDVKGPTEQKLHIKSIECIKLWQASAFCLQCDFMCRSERSERRVQFLNATSGEQSEP